MRSIAASRVVGLRRAATTISVRLARRPARSSSATPRTDPARPRPPAAVGARGRGPPAARARRCGRGTRCGRRSTPSAAHPCRGTRRDRRTRRSTGCVASNASVSGSHSVTIHGALGAARRAEHPLGVGGDRQAPRSPGPVLHGEHGDLDRVVERHELDEVELDAVVEVLEAAVSGAVARDVGRVRAANRLRRRAPQLTAVVVADVERLARRIADRIVGPRRQLVLAAVPGPGVAGAGLGDLEPERRVGDDVEPRGGRRLARAEDDDVLAAVLVEPAQSVEELELRQRRMALVVAGGRCRRRRRGGGRGGVALTGRSRRMT